MIYQMGVQYLGLGSLFRSIIQVLNLAELGIGSAMVFGMYKPIAENDETTICALMKLYKTYYRIIGVIIATIGVIITPAIPYLIKEDIPAELNVYILYYLNLGATVLSYWLFAYRNSILLAYQRIDIISKISLISNSIQYAIQLIILFYIKNYYLFLIVALFTQVLNNLLTAYKSIKMYPQYQPKGNISADLKMQINRKVKDLVTAKVGAVVDGAADTVVISSFLGITTLAIYQNYYYILTALISMISIIFNAIRAGIGNSLITETKEKNFGDFKKFSFMLSWILGFCTCELVCLYQPFMKLWVGEELMLNFRIVICLCLYFYIFEMSQFMITYKDAAGIWHEDRYRSIITATLNLSLNIFMVRKIGLYGIILSTVLATCIVGVPWLIHNIFSLMFERKNMKEYIFLLVESLLVTGGVSVICYLICSAIKGDGLLVILIKGVVCSVVSNVSFLVVFRNKKEFVVSLEYIKRIFGGRLPFLKNNNFEV